MAEKSPRAEALRALPVSDLQAQLRQLQQELWQHRLKTQDGSLQQTHLVRRMKRQIARVHTILQETSKGKT